MEGVEEKAALRHIADHVNRLVKVKRCLKERRFFEGIQSLSEVLVRNPKFSELRLVRP